MAKIGPLEPSGEPESQDQGLAHTGLDGDDILAVLLRQAERSGDIDAWLRYVTALEEWGRTGSALDVLGSRSANSPGSEESEKYQLELGRVATSSGLVFYGEFVMRQIARRSTHPVRRKIAEENLLILLEWRKNRDRDKRLREFQMAYFAEGLQDGRTGSVHYDRLARLTLELGQTDELGSRMASAIQVLEDGLTENPDSTLLLEGLARCLAGAGQAERLDETLRRIEELNPDSEVLRRFSAGAGISNPAGVDDNTFELVSFLAEAASSDDSEEVDAAIADLQDMVGGMPRSSIVRLMFGYAVINAGDREAALEQASLLADSAGSSHEEHYNVAQLFYRGTDLLNAQRHAELAMRYASTDGDRADAELLLSSLAQQDDSQP